MEDNMQNFSGVGNVSADELNKAQSRLAKTPTQKKTPVGGIIMGIFNLVLSAPVAILFFAVIISMILGAVIISNPEISVDAADNVLEAIVLGILQVLLMVYAIGLSFAISIFGTILTLVASIPSLIFFIVARFNRSKFFKISSALVFALTTIACILVVGACVFFVLAGKYGMM